MVECARTGSLVSLQMLQAAEMLLAEFTMEALGGIASIMRFALAADTLGGTVGPHCETLVMM